MDVDAQRKAAGERAAQFVKDGMTIGYGTGRAASAALEELVRRKARVSGVPTSQRTLELCQRLGLPVVSLDDHPRLDLVLDGADEVDPQGQMLKGGGGAHIREKLVALASARRIIAIEESKLVPRLGATRAVPIEVVAFGWKGTLARIAGVLPGAARRDGPHSDNGGVIVEAPLPADIDLRELARALKEVPGVVDHGLFLDLSPTVVVGGESGVRVISGG
ncbi:MAG TPA: ribose-5-phosphate isomerase RpiA [Myxococcales bacterium]|nr:ribose-5-phosphate isomerase RpiA [Myxococcales bacterium]